MTVAAGEDIIAVLQRALWWHAALRWAITPSKALQRRDGVRVQGGKASPLLACADPRRRLDACLLGNAHTVKRQKVFLYIGASIALPPAVSCSVQCKPRVGVAFVQLCPLRFQDAECGWSNVAEADRLPSSARRHHLCPEQLQAPAGRPRCMGRCLPGEAGVAAGFQRHCSDCLLSR